MRSKQTIFRYAGYEMRSHSETRWAAIMDALSIVWLYEPRVIDTRHGWYLPDFFIPAAGVFVEVKGPTPNTVEIEKAGDAETQTGCPVIFAHGRPELLHAELFHGLISYYSGKGEVSFSTAEIGALVRKHYDLRTYARYLSEGEHQHRPDVVSIGEALAEVIVGWMDRGAREQSLASIHMPLNEKKTAWHGQHSKAEWLLAEFATKASHWRAQREAA
ncbi:hypothetical protein D3879_14790 [Pseudomonas cavernicola]|uniref:Uncharacterized protein n=1 Tax=Pseudomonas cavernicola TaxID=2320866 RepID=A0A418XF24_9PSED|nr:hypothetical protein [Pseudomonas cavernicola]RJG10943.1 hypothetical protein D3879_14790 [Pseudomonas cavernicola]